MAPAIRAPATLVHPAATMCPPKDAPVLLMTTPQTLAAVDDPLATAGPIRRLEDNVGRVLRGSRR